MQDPTPQGVPARIGKGALAGLAGTVAMTAFQLLVEMPLTGRRRATHPRIS